MSDQLQPDAWTGQILSPAQQRCLEAKSYTAFAGAGGAGGRSPHAPHTPHTRPVPSLLLSAAMCCALVPSAVSPGNSLSPEVDDTNQLAALGHYRRRIRRLRLLRLRLLPLVASHELFPIVLVLEASPI